MSVRRILPAIPEGWEAVGPWFQPDQHTIRIVPLAPGEAFLRADGIIHDGETTKGLHRTIRRVPPPADWGDVPKGVTVWPTWQAGVMAVYKDREGIGSAMGDGQSGAWIAEPRGGATVVRDLPSLPAAIVALTGRRE